MIILISKHRTTENIWSIFKEIAVLYIICDVTKRLTNYRQGNRHMDEYQQLLFNLYIVEFVDDKLREN